MEAPRVPPLRRGVTLAEQLAASSNLRDLLKLRDDGDGDVRQLAAAGRRRTLLDVIRDVDDSPPPPSSSCATRRGVSTTAPVAGGATTAASASVAPPTAAAQGERRVSLMALLEQAERQWTAGGGERKRVEEDAALEEGRKAGVGGRCCVCMAHGKGAAFIPCGHTFCRACARELRAGRGRCPLCNAAIHEVLNLF